MRIYNTDTYFETQSEALQCVFNSIENTKYEVKLPESIWTEHVAYGSTTRYSLPLIVTKTGNPAKKWLHISLYRMDSGKYELTYYKS
jgi:hypothetical protein